MNFEPTEEQRLLADSVGRLVDQDYDFETRKKVVASDDGFHAGVWAQLAAMGVLALPFSAEDGGFGGGATDMVGVMQAIGRGLLLEPVLPAVATAGRLIARLGSAEQKARWLPGILDGTVRTAFAHGEAGARYDLAVVQARAARTAGGWRLDGAKTTVLHAPMATRLVVSARAEDGLALFVVDADAPGLRRRSLRTVDDLRAADVTLTGVDVPADARLGAGDALAAIEEATDFATVLLCAEAVGAMQSACDATLEYLKTRKQFGQPIGAFQALQHRMVDMTIATEQARSITLLACARVDAAARGDVDAHERARTVSAAKVKIAEACRHVGQEAIQLHGGMGMTIEMKVAHTFKRLTMLAQQCGDADHHLARFASAA